MSKSIKQIADTILNMAYKFRMPDEHSIDEDWLYNVINDARAEVIRLIYSQTGTVDQTWLSDLSTVPFYKVNRADDPSITCTCDIAKSIIPQFISLDSKEGNLDLGIFSISSTCGKYQYSVMPMTRWTNLPPEHVLSKFKYYWRINTALYVSDTPSKLRITGILHNPSDGYYINSAPIVSGSLVSGTTYIVKYGTVVYNGTAYAPNTQFTAGVPTTFTTTNGAVYLYVPKAAYGLTDPYPLSADLIRKIELDILAKEFNITENETTDVRNDSVDDKVKNG